MQEKKINLSDGKYVLTKNDKVYTGLSRSLDIVSWSKKGGFDICYGKYYDNIYVYEGAVKEKNKLHSLNYGKITELKGINTKGVAFLKRENSRCVIAAGRDGFLYIHDWLGEYPNYSFPRVAMVKDSKNGLPFNIQYENKNGTIDDLNGYIPRHFYNYIYPLHYPFQNEYSSDLILGDFAGNLWFLPDLTKGKGKYPKYQGLKYSKPEDANLKDFNLYISKYGREYSMPENKICSLNGDPIILGRGRWGGKEFDGYNVSPAIYKNKQTGLNDLLVITGDGRNKIYYLNRIDNGDNVPVFSNLGVVEQEKIQELEYYSQPNAHDKIAVVENQNGKHDLIRTIHSKIALFIHSGKSKGKPVYKFKEYMTYENIQHTNMCIASDILKINENKKRYLLESNWDRSHGVLREITVNEDEVFLSSDRVWIEDQNGKFWVEGETDPQGGKNFGTCRIFKWDYDGRKKNHLIVGSDDGKLYLLIEDEQLKKQKGKWWVFRSFGPLKDTTGKIIRIHNRVAAAGIDITKNGKEDLIVACGTYQMGYKTDPNPGCGVYYIINKGIDKKGIPILESPKNMKIINYEFPEGTNTLYNLQTVDIDNDGEKEIYIWNNLCKKSRFFELKETNGVPVMKYTGKYIPKHKQSNCILDIDNDGILERVIPGGESGDMFIEKINNYNNC